MTPFLIIQVIAPAGDLYETMQNGVESLKQLQNDSPSGTIYTDEEINEILLRIYAMNIEGLLILRDRPIVHITVVVSFFIITLNENVLIR